MGVSSAIVSHFLDPSDSVWGFFPRWRGVFSALLERAGTWPSRAGYPCGFVPTPLERQGTLACPAGAPFLGKKWGKEPPGEEVPPPGPPSLVGLCGGGCTSYGIPGLRPSQRKARNGPPTGWAGWGRGWVPFGRRQRGTVWFPAFSSRQQTTSPARPSWWAGHEALVLEAAGQAHTDPTTFPRSSRQRMGFQGEGTSFPLVFFPLFLQRNRAPPGQGTVPARSNGAGDGTPPTKGDRIS